MCSDEDQSYISIVRYTDGGHSEATSNYGGSEQSADNTLIIKRVKNSSGSSDGSHSQINITQSNMSSSQYSEYTTNIKKVKHSQGNSRYNYTSNSSMNMSSAGDDSEIIRNSFEEELPDSKI